ncbi:MAG: transporter substrate-binding protein [Paenibacillus sp.]|nr:transporter substrate-binding protein [Paenibacillus sp.]
MKKGMQVVAVCSVLLLGSTACGGSAAKTDSGPAADEQTAQKRQPVSLVLYLAGGALTDEEFQSYFAAPVQKKFPHITMTLVRNAKGTAPADMIASGAPMDIVYTSQGGWQPLLDLRIPEPLDEYVRTSKLPLDAFDPIAMQWLRDTIGTPGQLQGLPFSLNGSALFYNKDIFDKFGVGYPKDRMLWDEVLQLGARVARTENGLTYKPLFTGSLDQFAGQLVPSYTDPATDRPLFETDIWRKAAQYYKAISDLPGNRTGNVNDFFQAKSLAMYAGVSIYSIGQFQTQYASGEKMSWDLVSYPNFPESKGKGMALDVHSILLSSTGKHKEQAFEVMNYVLGEENQLAASRNGRISALQAKALKDQFGQNLPFLQGKNIPALFVNASTPRNQGKYYGIVSPLIGPASNKLVSGEEDVNTMLRNLNQAASRAVQEEKSK